MKSSIVVWVNLIIGPILAPTAAAIEPQEADIGDVPLVDLNRLREIKAMMTPSTFAEMIAELAVYCKDETSSVNDTAKELDLFNPA